MIATVTPVLPSSPTTGATAAAAPNCARPTIAAAVPATAPCRERAGAGAFGITKPVAHSEASGSENE